jgi:hypothetical protein
MATVFNGFRRKRPVAAYDRSKVALDGAGQQVTGERKCDDYSSAVSCNQWLTCSKSLLWLIIVEITIRSIAVVLCRFNE